MRILFLFFSSIFISQFTSAKPFRVNQIPNGNVNSCLNCHKSQFGGLPLSSFGSQVLSVGLNGENVDWLALYNLDADGDGFTNGQELLDPNGEWSEGMPNPGKSSDVKKPYDINSKPLSVWSQYINSPIISPNPSSSRFNISFNLKSSAFVNIRVVDVNGNFISHLLSSYFAFGEITSSWDGTTEIGIPAPKGVYFIQINVGNTLKVEKVILN